MTPEWRVWSILMLALVQTRLGETPIASPRRSGYVPNEVIVKLRATGTAAGAGAGSVKTLRADPGIPSDPWARFGSRIEIRQVRALRRATSSAGRSGVRRQSERSVRKAAAADLDPIYKLEVELEANQSLEDIIAILHEDPTVEYAERNQIVSIDYVPNDPYFSSQWSLANTGQAFPIKGGAARTGTAGADIAIESAWDVDTRQTEVVVAVLDTGVDYRHRDLANRMWVNAAERDGAPDVDDDRNGYVDDVYGYNFAIDYYREGTTDPLDDGGHGTHCAGIIAAEMDNDVDIAGICPTARIMAAKNLVARGDGEIFSSAEAIYYAVDNGADVISCSWGFASHSLTMEQAVNYAYSQGGLRGQPGLQPETIPGGLRCCDFRGRDRRQRSENLVLIIRRLGGRSGSRDHDPFLAGRRHRPVHHP